MSNAAYGGSGGGTSLLEELQGTDNRMQQNMNSGFSSLSFSSTIGIMPDSAHSSYNRQLISNDDELPYFTSLSSQQSSVYNNQSSNQQIPYDSQGSTIRNSFAKSLPSPEQSKSSFSPNVQNTYSQFQAPATQQQDPFTSFLSRPIQLDASDEINHYNNSSNYLSNNDSQQQQQQQQQSPFSSRNHGGMMTDAAITRERSYSSPGTYLPQPSYGAKSPPSSSTDHILYEDKPSSWDEGSGFPGHTTHMDTNSASYDRFNSRPPRHGSTQDSHTIGRSPHNVMRHDVPDGNFNSSGNLNMPYGMPTTGNMNSIENNSQGIFGSAVSFDSSVQGNRQSMGNLDTLNPNYQQYQQPGMGLVSPTSMPKNGNYVLRQTSALPMSSMQRHSSTGSTHFLVNEWGEIVGHTGPVVTHTSLDGLAPGGGRNDFPPSHIQRAESYAGQGHTGQASTFNQLQLNFNPTPFTSSPLVEGRVGSIGDGRIQHNRNNTEPIPLTLFRDNSGVNVEPRHVGETYFQEITREGNVIVESPEENMPPPNSYAAKLMMAKPPPVTDQTQGRNAPQQLTAGNPPTKSGPPRMIYSVKFKRSQKHFVLGQRITREVKIGCYVKVEADRGEDLGIVMAIIPVEKFVASNTNRGRSMTEDSMSSGETPHSATNVNDMKRIMRVATHDEISLLDVKREEEDELLKICSTKCKQRALPMKLVDAEYQFDRNKLTFFFQAEGRIDFRELVRDLFSIYKTRIWMEQIDKNGAAVDEQ